MALYDQLKTTLQSSIYQNSVNAVTGNIMQSTLLSFINTLGEGSGYMGLLSSGNKPTSAVDGKQFYIGVNSGGSTVNVDCSAVGLGTIAITRITMWLVWNDGTGWHKQDLFAGIAATIPTQVSDLSDSNNYEQKEDFISITSETGSVTITTLNSNTFYYLSECNQLTISGYGYDTSDPSKYLPLQESHILVTAIEDIDITTPSLVMLRNGDSAHLSAGLTYLITIKGILWKIEQY